MKHIITLCLTICLTGCAGLKNPQTRIQVGVALREAAQLGTGVYLTAHPEKRQAFDLAAMQLDELSALQEPSPAQLHAILAKLPVKELRGTKAQIAVGAAESVYRIFIAGQTPVEIPPVVKEFAAAIAQGIRRGLGPPPLPVPARFAKAFQISPFSSNDNGVMFCPCEVFQFSGQTLFAAQAHQGSNTMVEVEYSQDSGANWQTAVIAGCYPAEQTVYVTAPADVNGIGKGVWLRGRNIGCTSPSPGFTPVSAGPVVTMIRPDGEPIRLEPINAHVTGGFGIWRKAK